MEWREKYSTGINEVDQQHKTLFELVTILDRVCHGSVTSENERWAMLEKVIDRLTSYTTSHFRTEEKLMKQSGFPKFIEHKKRHDLFTETVQKYKELVKQKRQNPSDLLNLVESWIQTHILTADREYIRSISAYQKQNAK